MKQDKLCVICTGRFGDIMNILPLLKLRVDRGDTKASLMVASEFASILDGVSYVDPVIWEGDWLDLKPAIAEAKSQFSEVQLWQSAGPHEERIKAAKELMGYDTKDPMPSSFVKEQWRMAGHLHDWKLNLPLVFDKRNIEREKKLADEYILRKGRRPVVLCNLGTQSQGPQFQFSKLCQEYLSTKFWNFIDITQIRGERIYDMLGLYERAELLISVDSSLLHLAQAVPKLRVAALIQDSPSLWHGSAWRPNWIFTMRYGDANRIVDLYDRFLRARKPWFQVGIDTKASFLHVWSEYFKIDPDLRHTAFLNWSKAPKNLGWREHPFDYRSSGRDTHTVFKEPESECFPFVKDVIREACQMVGKDTVIILSRPDTCFMKGIGDILEEGLPVCGSRVVKQSRFDSGMAHYNTDCFAFTKGWWQQYQHDYPDMVMGSDPHWHRILGELIKKTGGKKRDDMCWRKPGKVIGVKETVWRRYNEALAQGWLQSNGINDSRPRITTQVKAQQINPVSLHQHGYNPSIVPLFDGFLMAYRSHRWRDSRTCLAIAELDSKFNVRNNQWLEPVIAPGSKVGEPLHSTEDPKLFYHDGKLHMAYVRSNFPDVKNLAASVHYGAIGKSESGWKFLTHYSPASPEGRAIEKNWVFFSHDGQIYCIYSCYPEYVLMKIDGDIAVKSFVSAGIQWPWGHVRGGTRPLEINGRRFRLFHSQTWNEPWPIRWRYWIGAMEVEVDPPFKPLRLGKEPIVGGSTEDDYGSKCFHFKPNVIFPGDWFLLNDMLKLPVGVNDDACYIVTLRPDELKL